MKSSAQSSASPEILAPAGSFDALKHAVSAGADAVYFGAGEFNARRNAQPIDMQAAADYCHLFGVKAYLTLNIALKDAEFAAVRKLAEEAYRAKIDAFIVSDLGIVNLLSERAPGVPLHASTQLGVASKAGAEFLKELGFARVVLAREAGLREIRAIASTGIETEYFVHGALCVAFSGCCLLSSVKNGESGNRGLCNQPCRLPYRVSIGSDRDREGYFLSPKDQCLLGHLEELRDAGVCSFKIEGRLKRAAYAGGVAKIYRAVRDGKMPDADDFSRLKRLFNRGDFTEGYAFDDRKRIVFPKVPSSIGISAGFVSEIRSGRAFFGSVEPLEASDGFKVLREGKECGGTVSDFKNEGENRYSFRAGNVRIGDEIRLTLDASFERELAENVKKLPVFFRLTAISGVPTTLEARSETASVMVTGAPPDEARTEAATAESLSESLKKLGETEFEARSVEVETTNAFVPKSEINALRRNAVRRLREATVKQNEPVCRVLETNRFDLKPKLKGIFLEVDTLEKALRIPDEPCFYVVFRPTDFAPENAKRFAAAFREKRPDRKLFLYTPPMLLENDADALKTAIGVFDGVVANSLAAFRIAKEGGKFAVAGIHCNLTNAQNPLIALSDAYVVSAELNAGERAAMKDGALYAFGRLPLMFFRHCPKRSAGRTCKNCDKSEKILLRDEKFGFPIERFESADGECRFRLLNAVNTDLGAHADTESLYLDFSTVPTEEIAKIAKEYGEKTRKSEGVYTLLHTKRGVR